MIPVHYRDEPFSIRRSSIALTHGLLYYIAIPKGIELNLLGMESHSCGANLSLRQILLLTQPTALHRASLCSSLFVIFLCRFSGCCSSVCFVGCWIGCFVCFSRTFILFLWFSWDSYSPLLLGLLCSSSSSFELCSLCALPGPRATHKSPMQEPIYIMENPRERGLIG